ncbi:MAG: hypothetical protein HC888_02185 [Candidatus Competibacteraceae bacterium]|nr:hypothetical protein [Candidatus Competibacteraceae bacterium]
MPVRKKPTAPQNVHEFIHAAGAEKPEADAEPIVPVKLRVPEQLLAQVDQAVSKRRPAPSRHQWLLEAIYEKLERDQSADEAPKKIKRYATDE